MILVFTRLPLQVPQTAKMKHTEEQPFSRCQSRYDTGLCASFMCVRLCGGSLVSIVIYLQKTHPNSSYKLLFIILANLQGNAGSASNDRLNPLGVLNVSVPFIWPSHILCCTRNAGILKVRVTVCALRVVRHRNAGKPYRQTRALQAVRIFGGLKCRIKNSIQIKQKPNAVSDRRSVLFRTT